MFLVIAEKPSVALALSKVLKAGKREDGYLAGEDCIVSWCLGHLAEYVPPEAYDERYQKWEFSDLPIIPKDWQLAVAADKKAQFSVLKKLLNRVDYVVNACDSGREGERIFRHVYDLAGSRIPVKRLWISSMEDTAIREGFAHLKDGSMYDGIREASICRAKADWLIGMNATRAFTTKYYRRLTVGRVQTPTLAMLVERQDAIDGFVKKAYYRVMIEGDGIRAVSENIKDESESTALAEKCNGKTAVVSKVEKVQRKKMPPKLYDLTTLQREANRIFGYTAQETLEELQELYEARLVTYPRTDSQYITEDMGKTVFSLLGGLPEMLTFLSKVKIGRHVDVIMNSDKVSDHHALLPTVEATKQNPEELPGKQRNLFCLICLRLAQAVSEAFIYEETTVTLLCEGQEFHAKGKVAVQSGFQEIEGYFRELVQKKNDVQREEKDQDRNMPALIPEGLYEGKEILNVTAKKSRHFTSPPRPYSEDTLLASMETAGNQEFDADTEKKGLGTPATRAAVIEKLVTSGYARRKGKQILPTAGGRELISVLPDYLKSASMTAEWENQLVLVEKGELSGEDFLRGITELIADMLEECGKLSREEQYRFYQREEIGTCPVCGNPVYESKKSFYCSDRECAFALWKENRFLAGMKKQMNKKMAAELLKSGRTHVEDLYSQKTGRTFAADLLMKVADGRVNFSLEFPKKTSGGKTGKSKEKRK